MMDRVAPAVRSRMMGAIRGHDTLPERRVRAYLHAVGLRFRLHDRRLPGSPDLAFPSRQIAVFVHGCFWHRHAGCRYATTPSTRADFWQAKFAANINRDRAVEDMLSTAGWQVFTIWECETRDELALDMLAWKILAVAPTRPTAPGGSHPP